MTGGTDSIHLTIFTDPMMGLSYESEPMLARLRDMYRGRIEFRYVMYLMVRDVADYMLPEELAMEQDLAFARNPVIHSLPSYLIQTHGNAMILQSCRAEDFAKAITHLQSRNP